MKTTSVYTGVTFRDRHGQLRVSDQKITFKPDVSPEGGKINKDSWKWGAVKKHLVSSRSNQKALLKLVSREDTSKSLVFALRNHDELDTICMDVTERLRASRRREEAGDDASITLDDTTHSATGGEFMATSRRSGSTRRGSNRRGSDITFSSIHIADENLPNLEDDSTASRGSATSRRRRSSTKKEATSGNSYMTAVGSKKTDQQRSSKSPLGLFMVLMVVVVASSAAAIRAGHLKDVVARSPILQELFFADRSKNRATKERKRGFFQNKKESEEAFVRKYCLWTTEPTAGKGSEECVLALPFSDKM